MKLSINLNKIALLRNARGENYPDLRYFANKAIDLGVDGLTLHPRPDHRHATSEDVIEISKIANNRGIKLCKTDYAFVINPDVKLYENTLQELIDFSAKNNDYAILATICDDLKYPNYKIQNKNVTESVEDYLNVDSVDGFAMLINKNKFKDNIYFDESFFLFLENDDLCLRKKKENNKIYIVKNAKINHLGGKSHSTIYETEIEYSRNWH